MKNIPESKKEELLEALKALASVFEGAEEKQDENLMPEELEAAIKELHNLAEKYDKAFYTIIRTYDDGFASGACVSCYGTIGEQIELLGSAVQQLAEVSDVPIRKILSDVARNALTNEMHSEEHDDAAE